MHDKCSHRDVAGILDYLVTVLLTLLFPTASGVTGEVFMRRYLFLRSYLPRCLSWWFQAESDEEQVRLVAEAEAFLAKSKEKKKHLRKQHDEL